MFEVVRQICLFAVCLAVLATPTLSRAQSAPPAADLSAVYNQAMAKFQAGDYSAAAADLEALVGRVEFSPQLEPIYYTIGSAYFNAANYCRFQNLPGEIPQRPARRERRFRDRAIQFAQQKL